MNADFKNYQDDSEEMELQARKADENEAKMYAQMAQQRNIKF